MIYTPRFQEYFPIEIYPIRRIKVIACTTSSLAAGYGWFWDGQLRSYQPEAKGRESCRGLMFWLVRIFGVCYHLLDHFVCLSLWHSVISGLGLSMVGLKEFLVLFLQFIPHCTHKFLYKNITTVRIYVNERQTHRERFVHDLKELTGGGDDLVDVCMFGEGFHALFFTHVEDQALLYQVLHLQINHPRS